MKHPQGAYYWMVDVDEKVDNDLHRKIVVFFKEPPEGFYLGCAMPLVKAPVVKHQRPTAYAYERPGALYSDVFMPEIIKVFGADAGREATPDEIKVPLYVDNELKALYILADIQRMSKDGRDEPAAEIAYLVHGLLKEAVGNEEIRVALHNIEQELLWSEMGQRELRTSFIHAEATHALEATL